MLLVDSMGNTVLAMTMAKHRPETTTLVSIHPGLVKARPVGETEAVGGHRPDPSTWRAVTTALWILYHGAHYEPVGKSKSVSGADPCAIIHLLLSWWRLLALEGVHMPPIVVARGNTSGSYGRVELVA